METKKLDSKKVAGIIMAISAIGIMILKYFTNGNLDSYIMPFILLCVSVSLYFTTPKNETKQTEQKTTKGKIILSLVSIALVSGIIMFFVTLL